MSDFIEKLAEEGQLTDEQVQKIGERVRVFLKEARVDPVLLEEAKEKLGFFGKAMEHPVWGKVLGSVLLGVGSAAGVAGVHAGVTGLQNMQNDMQKAKRYQEMLKVNPDLAAKGVDSKAVQRHFDTLHKFNPEYASDPTVAGTYVANSLEMARPSLDAINNMVRARKDIVSAKGDTPAHRAAAMTHQLAKQVGQSSHEYGAAMDKAMKAQKMGITTEE